jgi:glutamyl-tRNA synthetase
VRLLTEVPEAVRFLLGDEFPLDAAALEKVKGTAQVDAVLGGIQEAFAALPEWSGELAKAALGTAAGALGVKAGQMMFPLRVALSGKSGGPDLVMIMDLLGRDRCVQRIGKLRQALA